MGTIDDYLASLDDADRAVVAHVYDVARAHVPDTEQGRSYGMPALLHRGKALIAVMRTKKHFAVYPFSGMVPAVAAQALEGFDVDKGTIRFQSEAPLPDDAIRAVLDARVAEIADPSIRARGRD
ncbi:DUF1801 domain-containing protein [Microbacter sp. GSS18]|nr:DUF1801 domain-containing protein [Microbacter sp. GSS18]